MARVMVVLERFERTFLFETSETIVRSEEKRRSDNREKERAQKGNRATQTPVRQQKVSRKPKNRKEKVRERERQNKQIKKPKSLLLLMLRQARVAASFHSPQNTRLSLDPIPHPPRTPPAFTPQKLAPFQFFFSCLLVSFLRPLEQQEKKKTTRQRKKERKGDHLQGDRQRGGEENKKRGIAKKKEDYSPSPKCQKTKKMHQKNGDSVDAYNGNRVPSVGS